MPTKQQAGFTPKVILPAIGSTKGLTVKILLLSALLFVTTLPSFAKDHSSHYIVGTFSSTGELSDGSYANCYGGGCTSYNASHNVSYIRTNSGIYAVEAPVSVGLTMLGAMASNGNAPTIHKQWFMDQLHEGDKVLFAAKCNKHNNCQFWLPNPDKIGKEISTVGYYRADNAVSNTTTLCGKGKLRPEIEAQVCPIRSVPSTSNTDRVQ